jgi:hypothetical protein
MGQEWTDTTPQRLLHVIGAGLAADEEEIYLPSGLPSGVKRRRIEGPLEYALRHRWITPEQKLAGDRFLHHIAGTRHQLQFTTSRMEVIDGRGSTRLEGLIEQRSYHLIQLRKSLRAITLRLRQPFLDWAVRSIQCDISIAELGQQFTALNHREAKKAVGITILGIALDDLAKHFGFI